MTIEPNADGKTGLLVMSPLERGKPSWGLSTPINLPGPGATSLQVLNHTGVGVQFDLDKDGKPNLELNLTIAETVDSSNQPFPLEHNRNLYIKLKGPSLPTEAKLAFDFAGGNWHATPYQGSASNTAGRRTATATRLPTVRR